MKQNLQRLRDYALWLTMLFFINTSAFSQCPAPTINIDPNPPCGYPVELSPQPAGGYVKYAWSTGAITEKITVPAAGNYTVTVTCANGSTATAVAQITDDDILPQMRMAAPLLRPCLAGESVDLEIELTGLMSGITIITITSSLGEVFTIDQAIVGPTTIVFPVAPNGTATYFLTSVVNITYGCNYTFSVPEVKSTLVTPVFQSESEFPIIAGDPFFCEGGYTDLKIQWNDLVPPTGYYWAPPSPPTSITQTFHADEEGLYQVAVTYSPECYVDLELFVDEEIPEPQISGGPVCSGSPAVLTTDQPYALYEWSTGESDPEITITEPGQYGVTITTDHGCVGYDIATIPSFLSPSVSINGPISLCTGQNSANLVAVGANIATYAWSTGSSSANITANGPGDYTVTVTSNQGCTEEATQTIEQITTPVVTLMSPVSFCEGTPATLMANATGTDINYLWSTGATTAAIPLTTGGVYRVTVTDPTGECSTNAFSLVTVKPRPDAQISSTATSFCEGNTATLMVAPGNSYNWSSGSTASSITVDTSGNYGVTVTGSNGCTNTDTEQITLLQQSAPTAIAFAPLCNQTVQLTADAGYTGYAWSNGINAQSMQTGDAGPYTVTVTNAAGCTSSTTYNVTVLPAAPQPSLVPLSYLCQQGTVTINVGSGFAGYSWSNGSTTSSVVVTQAGPFTVTVTDTYGCTGTASQMVNAAPTPEPEVAGSLSICNGGATTLTVSGSYNSFEWSTGATTSSVNIGSSGIYTVTVTSQFGCPGTSAVEVVISTFLTPNIAVEPYSCNSQLTLFAGAGYTTYAWSNGATTSTIDVNTPGDYMLTVTNEAGCIGSAVQSVSTIPSTPALGIQGATSFCADMPATLTASPGFNIYNWSNGAFTNDVTVSTTGNYTVTATDIYGCTKTATLHVDALPVPTPAIDTEPYDCSGTLTLNSGGSYTTYLWGNGSANATLTILEAGDYALTVTNAEGCTGTDSATIAEIPERLLVAIDGPNRICEGTTALVTASAGFSAYEWSNGTQTAEISVSAAGTYTVTATDAYNCTSTSQLQVGLLDLPEPEITTAPYDCSGTLTLQTSAFAGYEWSTGSTTASASAGSSGTYTVTVTNDDGCTASATFEANVPAAPAPQISTNPQPNYSVELQATAGFTTYMWSTGATTGSIITDQNGTYTVTVTDASGCTGTAEVLVQLEAAPLTATPTSTEITCANNNDGQLNVCLTGGVAPYMFAITPSVPFQITTPGGCVNLFTAGNLTPGTYTWQVTDINGVTLSGSSTYTNPAPLVALASVSGSTVTGSATGGQPPYQYSINGANYQSDPVFTNLPNGAYQMSVLDDRGCTVLSPSVVVFTVGTDDVADNWQLQITPNPGDGNFHLLMNNCGVDEIQLTIRDVAGRLISQKVINTGGCRDFQHHIDLQTAPAGTYLVEVRTATAAKTLPVILMR